MADKEFTISDVLEPIGVGLNIPLFLGFRSQQTPSEVFATQEIIKHQQIHVERDFLYSRRKRLSLLT